MMNTGNIHGMVPRGNSMGIQPNQNGPPRQPPGMQHVTNQILATLQKTPLNPGWQSTVPINVRASFIIQL